MRRHMYVLRAHRYGQTFTNMMKKEKLKNFEKMEFLKRTSPPRALSAR
jgi:hypothetical protein